MYQNIDFSKTGGFPLTQDAMAFLQSAYNEIFSSLTEIIGTYGIISGVTNLGGGIYSDGWMTYDGEIVPFVGGAISAGPYVGITETIVSVTYRDSGLQGVIKTRKAGFTTDSSKPNISSFSRITLSSLETTANSALSAANAALTAANTALTNANTALSTANAALAAATTAIPSGTIMLWSGSIISIPAGYVLCNGLNSTPDLRDRFIVGAGSTYNPGNTGGANSVSLTSSQLPPHTHTVNGQTGGDNNDHSNNTRFAGGDKGVSESGFFFSINSGSAGSGTAHENRPPYYALCYIMKT